MTHPSELERPKDSLAVIVAELRTGIGDKSTSPRGMQIAWNSLADRIERLDAEMQKELDSKVHVGSGNVFRDLELPDPECRQQLADANLELAELRAELDACHSLLNDPRVRALFPALKDGTVLASCSGEVAGG